MHQCAHAACYGRTNTEKKPHEALVRKASRRQLALLAKTRRNGDSVPLLGEQAALAREVARKALAEAAKAKAAFTRAEFARATQRWRREGGKIQGQEARPVALACAALVWHALLWCDARLACAIVLLCAPRLCASAEAFPAFCHARRRA